MPHFMIETTHSQSQDKQIIGEILQENPKLLKNLWLGCQTGDHTGFAEVDAKNQSEALDMLTPTLRKKAHVVQVEKFSESEAKKMAGQQM